MSLYSIDCDFVSLGEYYVTFRRILLPSSSASRSQRRTELFFLDCFTLNMKAVGSFQTWSNIRTKTQSHNLGDLEKVCFTLINSTVTTNTYLQHVIRLPFPASRSYHQTYDRNYKNKFHAFCRGKFLFIISVIGLMMATWSWNRWPDYVLKVYVLVVTVLLIQLKCNLHVHTNGDV
jgi:hypothetical protein